MIVHSIQTSIGAAMLADLSHSPSHSIAAPNGWGLILYGKCCADRSTLLEVALNSTAKWIAECEKGNAAIVVWSSKKGVEVGDRVGFDAIAVEAVCPKCGSTDYVSNGINWACKDCGRQWRKIKNAKKQSC